MPFLQAFEYHPVIYTDLAEIVPFRYTFCPASAGEAAASRRRPHLDFP